MVCLLENRLVNYKETLMALYGLNWHIAQELSGRQIYFYQSSFKLPTALSDTIPLEYQHMVDVMNILYARRFWVVGEWSGLGRRNFVSSLTRHSMQPQRISRSLPRTSSEDVRKRLYLHPQIGPPNGQGSPRSPLQVDPVARRLLRRCKKAERRLGEANRGRVRRVTDIVVCETFKAIYEKATDGQCCQADRRATIRDRQEQFRDFGLRSPQEMDRLEEAVSFSFSKFYVGGMVS